MPASEAVSRLVNQPYFLANLFVETNTGLQHFSGLPPFPKPAANAAQPTITPYYTDKVTIPPATQNRFQERSGSGAARRCC